MTPNEKLLQDIQSRQEKKTEFNYGILTADRYVKTVQQCVGSDLCYRYAATKSTSFQDVLDKAAKTLVYSNPEMEIENRMDLDWAKSPNGDKWPLAMQGAISHWTSKQVDGEAIEIPPNTLMVFKHVLTTPRKDRDGDILRTEGAAVDPKMLLLWQHVHTLPIGKMLAVAEHTPNKLSLISAIVDMNELCHDAATMITAGMGRFSHGFRALEFEDLKEEEGETTSPGGFDVKRFEIMEASLVSVPSNTDAQTEEIILGLVEGGKLTSPLMKAAGEQIRANRPIALTFNLTDEQAKKLTIQNTETVPLTLKDEDDNEDQPGSRSPEGEAKEGCTCSPKETDDETAETKETATSNAEVAAPEGEKRHSLTGSWEWTEKILKQKAGAFLAAHAVNLRERFIWLAGTFADHAIICTESNFSDVPDEFLYCRAEWSIVNDEPVWQGTPQPVEITTSVEIRERSPLFDQKAGRTLSARNLRALQDVKEDLEELMDKENLSRGGGALCARAVGKLAEIIDAAGGGSDEETSTEVTVKEAIAIVLAEASSEERKTLGRILSSLEEVESQHELAEQLLALSAG